MNQLTPRANSSIGRIVRSSQIATLLVILAIIGGCVQHTFEPQQTNLHTVIIQTLKSTGTPAKNVQVMLFEENSVNAALTFSATTGDSGTVTIRLEIPTFGHSYSLRLKKTDPLGIPIFARSIYPLNLKCVDTVIRIVVPEVDTTVQRDSLCGTDVYRTLTYYACSDTSVSQTYTLTNCSGAAYVTTPSTVSKPFSITPSGATSIRAGGSQSFTITYDGGNQTSDASAKVVLATTPASGKVTLVLIGHLRRDCTTATQSIVCGQNNTSDSIRFGTVCQDSSTGPSCVTFVNSNSNDITLGFPPASLPFSYVVSDNNGAHVDQGKTLTLKQNEIVTLCFTIQPHTNGPITGVVKLPLTCAGVTGAYTISIPLSATATPCSDCNCKDFYLDPFLLGNNVRVNVDTTVTIDLYQNNISCPVTVDKVGFIDALSEWTLISVSPVTPAVLLSGGVMTATLRFHPTHAGPNSDRIHFNITPKSAGIPCLGERQISGTGCNSACADTIMPPEWRHSPAPNGPDTLFFKQQGKPKIFVSVPPKSSVSDEECITLRVPDTACGASTFTIIPPRSPLWTVTTSPSTLRIAPGGTGTICIVFTAPPIRQVRLDFTQPNQELKYPNLLTIIDPQHCTTTVPLKAVVDTFPQCNEFQLASFDSMTTAVYTEAYSFGDDKEHTTGIIPGTIPFPDGGDLFLQRSAGNYPVTARLPGQGFILFQSPSADICANITTITKAVNAFIATAPVVSQSVVVALGNSYLFQVGGGIYGLIRITDLSVDADKIPYMKCQVLYPFF
jgi:hypothetical protein